MPQVFNIMKFLLAISSNLFLITSHISHLKVQYIYALSVLLSVGHILIPSILKNKFSSLRIYSQFPNSQGIVYF